MKAAFTEGELAVNVRTLFVCAFALLASLGCDDPKPTSGALPTATATAQVKTAIASVQGPPTAAPSSTATGSDRGKMVHCPSAVDGVSGDPRRADAALATAQAERIVDLTVAAIRERIAGRQSAPRP